MVFLPLVSVSAFNRHLEILSEHSTHKQVLSCDCMWLCVVGWDLSRPVPLGVSHPSGSGPACVRHLCISHQAATSVSETVIVPLCCHGTLIKGPTAKRARLAA